MKGRCDAKSITRVKGNVREKNVNYRGSSPCSLPNPTRYATREKCAGLSFEWVHGAESRVETVIYIGENATVRLTTTYWI